MVIVQDPLVIAVIRGAHWLIPLSGHWDLIMWIGVGAPLAAAIDRFNKAHFGAATRPPLWDSRRL